MNKERNLLPWILGALSATAVAVAITAVSSNKTAPVTPPPMVAAQPTPLPVPPVPSATPLGTGTTPADAATPAVAAIAAAVATVPVAQADRAAAQPSPVQAQTAPESAAQSGQIWACTTKGVKTFSNNPCGEKSTLLEVGPINTMNATPAVHYTRSYASQPQYAPAYTDSDYSADQESYADQASAETGGNTYTIVQGGFVRRRPEHRSHHRPMPSHHNSGSMPRKY